MPPHPNPRPSGRGPEPAEPAGPGLVDKALGRPVDERMYRYVDMLATSGVERGLIGPREVGRLWERHILNCVLLEQLIPAGRTVADLGSGAGLPGIVLGLVRPDLRVTLVEPLLRRATFLSEAVAELGLGEAVKVVRVRAEEYQDRRFAVVTARAVAPLDRLASLALQLLTGRGTLLAMKGQRAHHELEQHRAAVSRLGYGRMEVVILAAPAAAEPTRVVVADRTWHRRQSKVGPERRKM